MDFYNFFSFSAKKAIYRASEICTQFNNQYLEPEHAFYSILNLRSCSAVQVLHQLGINLPKLTYSLEAWLYEHAGSHKGNAVFSQRTIQLLDSAYKEVKRLHHHEIGTTHLLIALAGEKGPFLSSLFDEHGLDAKKVRDTFLTHLKGYSQQGESRGAHSAQVGATEEDQGQAGEYQEPVVDTGIPVGGLPNASAYVSRTANAVLRLAEVAAANFGHEQIRPAHLLYGLLHQGNPHVLKALTGVGYNIGELIAGFTDSFRANSGPKTQPEFDRGSLRIVAMAFELMLHDKEPRIKPGHLLGALVVSDVECQQILAIQPEAFEQLRAALLHSGIHEESSAQSEA